MSGNNTEYIRNLSSLLGVSQANITTQAQLVNFLRTNKPSLVGNKKTSIAEVSQWLTVSKVLLNAENVTPIFAELNNFLATRSYFAGSSLTLADVSIYSVLRGHNISDYANITRWFSHVGTKLNVSSPSGGPATVLPIVHQKAPEVKPEPAKQKADSAKSETTKSEAPTKTAPKEKKAEQPAQSEKVVESKAGDAADADADPSALDFRVGIIRKCWEHPEADKLLCEEIDIGESTGPRSIASGLRAFYKAEEMVGKKVLILANLKERTMVGFKSQGMVICASNEEHTVVKLLEVPAEANIGDRVVFPGYEGKEPLAPNVVAKKKVFEKVAPNLHTDANGTAFWAAVPFTLGGKQFGAPVPNAKIS